MNEWTNERGIGDGLKFDAMTNNQLSPTTNSSGHSRSKLVTPIARRGDVFTAVLLWSGICFGVDVSGTSQLAVRRTELESEYRQRLETLRQKCLELGLEYEAGVTGNWYRARDPGRIYVSLGPEVESIASGTYAPKVRRQWFDSFRGLRQWYAGRLWLLAEQARADGNCGVAARTLFDILREDPHHEMARAIVPDAHGSQQHRARVRRPKARHQQFGWRGKSYWIVESEHYRVETNHARQSAEELARLLEDLHAVWTQLFVEFWCRDEDFADAWDERRRLVTPNKKHRVVLFSSRNQYLHYLQPLEPLIGITLGIYRHPERTAYFYSAAERPTATWIHEAVHQLFHEITDASEDVGLGANFWIIEGIALYMESLHCDGAICMVGGIDADRLQYARYRALNEEFYVPLHQLVSLGREELQQDSRIRRLYSQAAGLSHFLMHHDQGHYRRGLVDYLRQVYAQRDGAETLARLAGQPLERLDREYREFLNVTDDQLSQLPVSRTSTKLALGHTSVTDVGLLRLGDVRNLQWIDLSFRPITDQGFLKLQSATGLQQCSLERTRVTDLSLDIIAKCRDLEELDLTETSVSNAGVAKLVHLRNLQALWLAGTKIDDGAVQFLGQLKSLETLDVSGTAVTPKALNELKLQLPRLKE